MKRTASPMAFDDEHAEQDFGFIETLPTPIRCLSIHQPWASRIVAGRKWIENRAWLTNHRGPLAIHATVRPDVSAMTGDEERSDLPCGAILGMVEVVACVPAWFVKDGFELGKAHGDRKELRKWFEEPDSGGPFCWLLANPKRLWKPIACRGSQGLWTYKGS